MVVYKKIFGSIAKLLIQLTGRAELCYYSCLLRDTLDIHRSPAVHMTVRKSVNIRAVLRSTEFSDTILQNNSKYTEFPCAACSEI